MYTIIVNIVFVILPKDTEILEGKAITVCDHTQLNNAHKFQLYSAVIFNLQRKNIQLEFVVERYTYIQMIYEYMQCLLFVIPALTIQTKCKNTVLPLHYMVTYLSCVGIDWYRHKCLTSQRHV